jgi:hypothetical protein
MEITKKKFAELLEDLATKNSKVKKLLADCGGFENLPAHIQAMIDFRLGITRGEKIILNEEA